MRITWKENELKRKHIMYSVQRTHTVSGASLKCMPWQLWNCSLYCILLIKLNRVQFFFLSFISKCYKNDFLCLRQVRTRLSLRECFSLFFALLLFAATTSLYFFLFNLSSIWFNVYVYQRRERIELKTDNKYCKCHDIDLLFLSFVCFVLWMFLLKESSNTYHTPKYTSI